MSDQGTSEQAINGPKCIEIPRGWSRILENGSILYIRYVVFVAFSSTVFFLRVNRWKVNFIWAVA